MDEAYSVEEASAEPMRGYASTRYGVSGCGGEGCATTAPAPDPETPPDSWGFLAPRSSWNDLGQSDLSHFPVWGTGSCIRCRSCCWIRRNLPRMRLRIVVRRTMVTVNFTLQGSASP